MAEILLEWSGLETLCSAPAHKHEIGYCKNQYKKYGNKFGQKHVSIDNNSKKAWTDFVCFPEFDQILNIAGRLMAG